MPLRMRDQMIPGWEGFDDRRSYWAYVFGRLRPDTPIEQAQEAVNVTYSAIVGDVEAPLQEGMSDSTLERFRSKRIALAPGAQGQSSIHDEARAPLILLFAVTAIVLVIACANIANLLLVRAASRGTELAVRMSIGAGRRHVIGQLLTESCLLGLMGGIGGLFMARWTLQAVVSILPPEATASVPRDPRLAYSRFRGRSCRWHGASLRALSGQSAAPGRTSWQRCALKAGSRPAPVLRGVFEAFWRRCRFALAMALLVSAGLFVKSLQHVSQVELGLRTEGMMTFGISPDRNGYEPQQTLDLFGRIEAELRAVPGVTGVTASMVPLIAGSSWGEQRQSRGLRGGS